MAVKELSLGAEGVDEAVVGSEVVEVNGAVVSA